MIGLHDTLIAYIRSPQSEGTDSSLSLGQFIMGAKNVRAERRAMRNTLSPNPGRPKTNETGPSAARIVVRVS